MNAAANSLWVQEIIRLLDLRPHPEGGHYRETFRFELAPADFDPL